MRHAFLAAIIIIVTAVSVLAAHAQFFGSMMAAAGAGKGTSIPPQPPATITGVTVASGTTVSYTSGISSGSSLGAIAVQESHGTFSGTLALGGTNAADFALSSTALPANLDANGSTPTCTSTTNYSITITPTQAGAVNSGTAYPITVTCNPVGAGTITPNTAAVTDTDVSGHVATGFYLWSGSNIVPWSGQCSWSGDSIVVVKNFSWINDPYSRNGCILELSRNLSSSDDGNHTGTVTNSGGQSVSFTLNVRSAAAVASTPLSTINNILLGVYDDASQGLHLNNGTTINTYFTRNFTYTGACPGYTSLDSAIPNVGAIMVWNMTTNCSDGSVDWNGIAAGNYDSTISSDLQSYAGQHYTQHLLYGVTLNNEWQGPPTCTASGCCAFYGPYWNESTGQCVPSGAITPSQWVNAVCHYASLIRAAYPGVPVSLQDPAQQAVYGSGTDIQYWPPSLYSCIDHAGHNMYFFNQGNPGEPKWQDLTADDSGDSIETVGQALAWASITGKPYEADEGCDSSSDGVIYPQFFQMIGSMITGANGKGGMSSWGIWNSNAAASGCQLYGSGANAAESISMENMLANYSYTPGVDSYPAP